MSENVSFVECSLFYILLRTVEIWKPVTIDIKYK